MTRRVPALARRGGRSPGTSAGGGAPPDYLYTQSNIPLDGETQFETIASAGVDSRLLTGHWSIEVTVGDDFGVAVEHILYFSNSHRLLTFTGGIRLYTGTNSQITLAELGSPAPGATLLIDVNFATGAWSVSTNGGTPFAGPPLGGDWSGSSAIDLILASNNGVSSTWSGTMYPAIGASS